MFPSFLFHAKPRKLLCLTFGVQFNLQESALFYYFAFTTKQICNYGQKYTFYRTADTGTAVKFP